MKLFGKIALAVMALLTLESVSAQNDTLLVVSFNLRFGEKASMAQIARFINSTNADLVALQECDWNTSRERAPLQSGVRFINELACMTEMFGIYGKAIDYRGGYYGVGILSRRPIISSKRVLLPCEPGTEQRVMLVAEIEMSDSTRLTFINTHLDVKSDSMRLAQTRFITEYVDNQFVGNIILAGDMNDGYESRALSEGLRSWQTMTGTEYTFSVENPRLKIDHIYVRAPLGVELLSTKVHTEIRLSDHFPIESTFIIKNQ